MEEGLGEETGNFDQSEERISDNIYGEAEIDDKIDTNLPVLMNVDGGNVGNDGSNEPAIERSFFFQSKQN